MEAYVQACPVCGETHTTDAPVASGFEVVAGGRAFRHPPYSARRCETCGLYFKSARLSDADLADYYARLAYESFETEGLMPTDRLIVRAASELPPGSRILDFGCGVGRSLAHSAQRHACYGVEPNARAAEVARKRGITIIADSELDAGYAGFFDMIVLSDVYEHLPRPLRTVLRMRACLKPGGKLVLVTGFGDAVRPPELLSEFWYFRVPGHLQMVSRAHLEWVARRASLGLGEQVVLCHYDARLLPDTAQRIRLWAYAATHLAPSSMKARLVRALPVLKRAAVWNNAPMLSCGSDHVFALFTRTES